MNKIIKAMEELHKAAKCAHAIEYLRDHASGDGVVGRCRLCRCRITSWPGTPYYAAIVAAREQMQRKD